MIDRYVRGQFDESEAVRGDVEDAEVGDDPLDHAFPGVGERALVHDLVAPSRATCSIRTMTRLAPWTRSTAPPMPLIIFPGIIQLAMSPPADTCMAPRIAASTLPARIIPKLNAESKKLAPARTVTVSLPALLRSGSTASSDRKSVG